MAFNAGAIIGTADINSSGWNKGLKQLSKGIAGFAAGGMALASAAMVKATKTADTYQKELANVTTLLDTSKTSVKELSQNLLGLDSRLGSTTELTKATYQAFSAGAEDMDEAMQITTDAATFAKAALTDTATAVDVLTTAQNAYGSEVVDTQKASDIFFTTIKEGKINGEQLSGVIGQSIPLFASMNIPLEQLGAGLATMTKQGVNSAEATTQLNGIVNAFIKPSEQMTAALEEQGYASGAAFIESEGLTGALEFLETQTGGAADKVGELVPNLRGLKGVMSLTGEGGDIFAETMEAMAGSAGATAIAFEKQEVTWETARNSLGKLEISVGNMGKVFADKLAVNVTEAADGMLQFITAGSTAELVGDIMGDVAGAFAALKEFMEPIVDVVGPGFKEIMGDASENLNALRGESTDSVGAFDMLSQASQFTALGLEVMLKIVNANINGIINLIGVMREGGQTIGSFFQMLKGEKTWGEVKQEAGETWDALKGFGEGMAKDYKDVWGTLKDGVQGFGEAADNTAIEIQGAFIKSSTETKARVVNDYSDMILGVLGRTEDMKNELASQGEEVGDNAGDTNDVIEDSTLTMMDKLKASWKAYFAFVDDEGNKLTVSFKDAFDATLSAGSALVSGMSSITDMETQNQLDAISLQTQAQEDALQEKLDKGLITEDEYNTQIEAMNADALAKENALNQAAFESNKKWRTAEIWMSAAQSIAGWWSTAPALGPIAGPAFAGAMTLASLGMAGKQSSLVAEQQFVPARAMGGMAGGRTRVNEQGGEIITLPDGSQVIPNDISKQIAESAASAGSTVNFYGNMSFGNKQDIDYFVAQVEKKLGRRMKAS